MTDAETKSSIAIQMRVFIGVRGEWEVGGIDCILLSIRISQAQIT